VGVGDASQRAQRKVAAVRAGFEALDGERVDAGGGGEFALGDAAVVS
jgi:hypothetical protein